ncbi:4-amino-4-deoxy-L-arabinose-phosphoundecaprenol flippase subunit ArnE [Erwinia psidii]|uniref:Probable 4-amino-4-deoxy-L-arabinose-phosphoundecaprenol flippase subunit ArnE n=1 Tax=Erwinia psidii TaxID=69224 RepID=A0A3N6SIV3_9GAMM|nr:4-amino-4-deoxy-L-arabinose-phosphoundecaprenol flippase subunit ArnE [Erwinia psidii]MCX8957096.1 4-amino-4-deoxy-L-arabinose-phosphoundecaprenol flippase subunit ArnE [Erwinia psidii]MCX8961748.1 4-amino-4-deoxy-L-arabinose-phosphoundecaprenol flippase subunit ArnE [Erwinia psidii]MCX8965342.1 4-amino-4-deoxy-L-arabinose-phosphoundecaprenol flippase subunit ArnE [Erwinia psidii]RQM37526.1 4-amino-4-deoxy-L-arabinose-phosphoundecaprenol flippase subunit ArnE [Erwinia psidii]
MNMLLVVLASLLSCGGQLCQKQAAHHGLLKGKKHLLFWLGLSVLLLGSAMLIWLRVLQHVPVGVAYPMLSLNFILVVLAARWLWQEPVSSRRWLGICLIVLGVAVMGVYA